MLRFGRNDGEYPQLKTNAAIIPAKVSTNPITSIGTRLLPEYGSACSLLVTTVHDWPLLCSCLVASKSFPVAEHDAVGAGDAEFEAGRDPPRPFDKMRFRLGRADLAGGLLEQLKPAVEMIGVDRQRQMLDHRRAVVAARHQGDR